MTKLLKGKLVVPVRTECFRILVRSDSGAPITARAKVITYTYVFGKAVECTYFDDKSFLLTNVTSGILKLCIPTEIDKERIPKELTLIINGKRLHVRLSNNIIVTVDLRPPTVKILRYEVKKTMIWGTSVIALYVYVKADDPGPYGSGVADVSLLKHSPMEVEKVGNDVWRILAYASTAPGVLFSDYVVVKDRQGNVAKAPISAKLVLPTSTTVAKVLTKVRTVTVPITITKTVTVTKVVSKGLTKAVAAVVTKGTELLKNPVVIALLTIIAALSIALIITVSKLSKIKSQMKA